MSQARPCRAKKRPEDLGRGAHAPNPRPMILDCGAEEAADAPAGYAESLDLGGSEERKPIDTHSPWTQKRHNPTLAT